MTESGKSQGRSDGPSVSEQRVADRRRTILRAAVDVFARKGYHGCRIADIAKEAGVAYGLVYHYFQNKDELLKSVFESAWAAFLERVQRVSNSSDSLEEKVRGIVGVAFDAYRRDPRAIKVLILEIGRSPAGGRVNRASVFSEVVRLAAAMFAEAQARKELRDDLDPVLCAALLFGAIEMGLTTLIIGVLDRKSSDALAKTGDQIARVFLHGVIANEGAVGTWKTSQSATKSRGTKPF